MIWAAIAFNTTTHERKYTWVELDSFESVAIDSLKLNPKEHCQYVAMQLNLQKYKCFLKT